MNRPWRGAVRGGAAALAAAAALLLRPLPCAAHLVSTGMGPVYDGIGHLLLTPEDLVAALALALYAGMRGTAAGRRALFLLPLAWLAGGALGTRLATAPALPLGALSFLLLGALVAADLRLPLPAVSALAVLVGVAHGVANGAALRGGPGIAGVVGVTAMLFALLGPAAALAVSLDRPWARIAVRVAGSWVCASGLLMLGWFVRGRS